ncbi:MAG: BMP family ABC transporter substrate-binding protein [Actinobacteria bacterium]|nr:BMP family ABC transporter substrate-binding protein [Actinomycetota bacterium]
MQKKTLRRLGASIFAGAVALSGMMAIAPAQAATKTIGIAYSLGGRDVPGFNQLAYIGVKPILDKNKALKLIESQDNPTATDDQRAERLRLMAKRGANPIVVVGFTYASALAKVAPEFPKVQWGIVDDSSVKAPNVQGIVFKEEEGSYLVGLAAAMTTKSGRIGFIGGVNTPLIKKFEAGYIAGAKAINPKKGMYQNGADVVYAAAGGTGTGMHRAASELKKWSIGVDADEATYPAHAAFKSTILTSMLKRVDLGVRGFVNDALAGKKTAGLKTWGYKQGGVGYTKTGGYLKDVSSVIDNYGSEIASGKVVVPSDPTKA